LEAFLQRNPIELGYFAANWTIPLLRDALALGIGLRFSDDLIRNALSDLGYAWKRPRYVLEPDPDREKKNGKSAEKSAGYRVEVWSLLKMKRTSCSSRPCEPVGVAVVHLSA
jgi:hypothetical protein